MKERTPKEEEELGELVKKVLKRDRCCVFCGSEAIKLFKHSDGPTSAKNIVLGCQACIAVINEYRRLSERGW